MLREMLGARRKRVVKENSKNTQEGKRKIGANTFNSWSQITAVAAAGSRYSNQELLVQCRS